MAEKIYIAGHNIISPLGFTTEENFSKIKYGISGITLVDDNKLSKSPIFVSKINNNLLDENFSRIAEPEIYTKFEKLLLLSSYNALLESRIPEDKSSTLLIISTTKGNIELLDDNKFDKDRLFLWDSSNKMKEFYQKIRNPIIVSNACISGVAAIIMAKRLLQFTVFDNAIVVGADILTEFVLSGFQSFMAISPKPCKPFDESRDGLSLGEGSGTIILTKNPEYALNPKIFVGGSSISNDANHISGPSRTGDGLYQAINIAVNESNLSDSNSINFISAHGTATSFNDEMEAKAFGLAGLQDVPVNSLKGYYGHTLGAAGIIESVVTLKSMEESTLIKSAGFNKIGVTEHLNIIMKTENKNINKALKTASGFGGCNAAVIFEKDE